MKYFVFFSLFIALTPGCTVYKSEGKKSFESATNEYGDRVTASEKAQCEKLDQETVQDILTQIESGASPLPENTEMIYADEDQSYSLCVHQD